MSMACKCDRCNKFYEKLNDNTGIAAIYRSNMQMVTILVITTYARSALKSFMSGSGNMERSLIAYRRKRK